MKEVLRRTNCNIVIHDKVILRRYYFMRMYEEKIYFFFQINVIWGMESDSEVCFFGRILFLSYKR